jgi:hypothetical protein
MAKLISKPFKEYDNNWLTVANYVSAGGISGWTAGGSANGKVNQKKGIIYCNSDSSSYTASLTTIRDLRTLGTIISFAAGGKAGADSTSTIKLTDGTNSLVLLQMGTSQMHAAYFTIVITGNSVKVYLPISSGNAGTIIADETTQDISLWSSLKLQITQTNNATLSNVWCGPVMGNKSCIGSKGTAFS